MCPTRYVRARGREAFSVPIAGYPLPVARHTLPLSANRYPATPLPRYPADGRPEPRVVRRVESFAHLNAVVLSAIDALLFAP
jgi:hypothetical protein